MKKTLLPVFACLALLFCASPAFALTDEEFLDLVLNDEVEEVRTPSGQNATWRQSDGSDREPEETAETGSHTPMIVK